MPNLQHEKATKMILLENICEPIIEGSYTLFIRHADRYPIPESEFGNDVELNNNGFNNSFLFGKKLKGVSNIQIHTSPVKRCIQTSESIIKGTGRNLKIAQNNFLGDPGAFIEDGEKAGITFLTLGFTKCYNDLMSHIPVEGFREINDGSKILTNLFEQNRQENTLNIYVSHDMIIALYAFATFGRIYKPHINWVEYLNGLLIRHAL